MLPTTEKTYNSNNPYPDPCVKRLAKFGFESLLPTFDSALLQIIFSSLILRVIGLRRGCTATTFRRIVSPWNDSKAVALKRVGELKVHLTVDRICLMSLASILKVQTPSEIYLGNVQEKNLCHSGLSFYSTHSYSPGIPSDIP